MRSFLIALITLAILLSFVPQVAAQNYCQWCIYNRCENTAFGFVDCEIRLIPNYVCVEYVFPLPIGPCKRYLRVDDPECFGSGTCEYAY